MEQTERGGVISPVHFVCTPDVIWPELKDGAVPELSGQRLSDLSGGITNSWVQRTYYHLARAGLPVTLGTTTMPGKINVVGVRDFGRRAARADCFTLIPRGDAHSPMLADFVILQNGVRGDGPRRLSIPHWPQPGILPRDSGRGVRIERLVYKGRRYNLSEEFRSQSFIDSLGALGVSLEVDGFDKLRGEHSWNNYYNADLVLGVRDVTRYDASKKPASKLINAWLAGTPALLGPEPAYRELRRSDLDYIEVFTPNDVLTAIERLQAEPNTYRRMVACGTDRAASYSEAALTRVWIDALAGPVAAAFAAWKRKPRALRLLRYGAGLALEGSSKRIDRVRSRYGPRILSTRALR
ncbi:glycosyltransferase family 1 protein [Rhodovulum sp. 12E13]|uniref:glycosyltransferase family 1 protein n=1 Tax=Rhodovulum sp. 12E13 TaxID=2203891 RepID=UPI0011C078C3|nr:glycosyltransferase family 1 protein [Rhodovulum sp. 12E13]